MNSDIRPDDVLAQLIVIFFAIGLHEFAHCKFADLAGDPTPRYYGRVTLNLFKHFDPLGSILILYTVLTGIGIGWGKPAPMDPRKMRNPRWDWFIAVIAGPLSNVLQAVVYAMVLRLAIRSGAIGPSGAESNFVVMLLIYGVIINLGLAMFNLIPFGPLDGKWLLGLLLPERQRVAWFQFNQRVGLFGLLLIIVLLQFGKFQFLFVPVIYAFHLLTGVRF